MAVKKPANNKPRPIRFCFLSDDDGHNYLVRSDLTKQFEVWLAAGPYWENYDGDDFDICRIDGVSDYTFTDPRSDL